jgi:hypothetical protein
VQEASELAAVHAHEFLPYTTAYQQAEALGVADKHVQAINEVQAAAAAKGL